MGDKKILGGNTSNLTPQINATVELEGTTVLCSGG